MFLKMDKMKVREPIKQEVDTSSEFDEAKYLEMKKRRMKYLNPR